MRIGIGSDHGGFELKEKLRVYLNEKSEYDVVDFGTKSEDSVDYPEYGFKVAKAVANKEVDSGIVICGTGLGISMAANKVEDVRAALCHNEHMASMARQHNNANVLALGGRTTTYEDAVKILEVWLKTEFEGGRHEKRVAKLKLQK